MSCPKEVVFLHLTIVYVLYIFLGFVYWITDDKIVVVKSLGTFISVWFICSEIVRHNSKKTNSQQIQTEQPKSPVRQHIQCPPIPRQVLLTRPCNRPRFYRVPNISSPLNSGLP